MRSAAGTRFPATRALRVGLFCIALAPFLLLPFAGRFLHEEDPLQEADLVFVLAGARVERLLEAVDLYREGWAPRIVLSPGPVDPAEPALRARGVHYPREGDLAARAIVESGIPAAAVSVLPGSVDNTAHEALALREALRGTPAARVIVVTSPYHTRRTRFAFRRAFAETGVEVRVRASRHSASEPAQWWRRRADVRFVVSELQKLLFYVAGAGA